MDNPTNPDVMTVTQMTSMLRDDGTRVRGAQRALEAAEGLYARATDRFYYSTDEAHQASFKEHAGPLAKAEDSATGVASAAEANARAVLAQIPGDTITLDAAGMAEAATRQALLAHDAANLPLDRLMTDVRAAIAHDDKPAMFLYAKLVSQRLAEPQARDAQERQQSAVSSLRNMVWQINDALRDRSFDALRQQALDAIGEASTLRSRASKRERKAQPLVAHDGSKMVAWPNAQR